MSAEIRSNAYRTQFIHVGASQVRHSGPVRQVDQADQADRPEEELTPLHKVQRSVRAIRFAHRLGKSAEQKESLDDVMVEVAEAVAQHWL
eukprot:COSAG06_NODE_35684_length_457_cov_0.293296_1_plen_89_part_01